MKDPPDLQLKQAPLLYQQTNQQVHHLDQLHLLFHSSLVPPWVLLLFQQTSELMDHWQQVSPSASQFHRLRGQGGKGVGSEPQSEGKVAQQLLAPHSLLEPSSGLEGESMEVTGVLGGTLDSS
jgi:hypothetical protein